jgi:oligoribonuclease NrnB/cAMP/cGMP phosphodiesterase (DHH superfamily)
MKVFHHNDLDGRLSAAIVLMKYPEAEVIELDYKQPFPFDKVQNELVWIVDFSLQNNDWNKLFKINKNVIWIDHHATAINKTGVQNQLKGFRSTTDGSAAMLVWKYVFKKKIVPWVVRLVSDWDTWTHTYKESTLFMYGMKANDDSPKSPLWAQMMDNEKTELRRVLDNGEQIKRAWESADKEYLKRYAFETQFMGYGAIVVNRGMISSLMFGDKANQYDLMISFVYDGNGYVMSLYSTKPNINCGKLCEVYAEKHGGTGGGHAGAAGCIVNEVPF